VSESTTYLTVPEAQAYLRFPSRAAFRVWAKRNGLPCCRRGARTLLFLRRDLDDAVGNTRGKDRGFQSRSARFQQSQGALHGAHVSGEGVGEFHAGDVTEGSHGTLLNSIEQVTR
jgi:hypothetical protein